MLSPTRDGLLDLLRRRIVAAPVMTRAFSGPADVLLLRERPAR
jgi:hypothetical protein